MKYVHYHEKLKCHLCEKSYGTQYHLNRHIKNAHGSEEKVKCQFCEKEFSKDWIKSHVSKSHGEPTVECDICHCVLSSASLEMHKKHVHAPNSQSHTCEICAISFTLKASLERHKNYVHANNSLFCGICQKSFSQPSAFYAHRKKIHTN